MSKATAESDTPFPSHLVPTLLHLCPATLCYAMQCVCQRLVQNQAVFKANGSNNTLMIVKRSQQQARFNLETLRHNKGASSVRTYQDFLQQTHLQPGSAAAWAFQYNVQAYLTTTEPTNTKQYKTNIQAYLTTSDPTQTEPR